MKRIEILDCQKCGCTEFVEKSIFDDIDLKWHCVNCGNRQSRYQEIEEGDTIDADAHSISLDDYIERITEITREAMEDSFIESAKLFALYQEAFSKSIIIKIPKETDV